jgi:Uncharacterized conserved protein
VRRERLGCLMPHWIWQHKKWTDFAWDESEVLSALLKARQAQSRILGFAEAFNVETQGEICFSVLTDEIKTSSEIEGEILNLGSLRSSIARRLGLPYAVQDSPPDRYIEGVIEMMVDATMNYNEPLTFDRLCAWQASLFPTGYSHLKKINVGQLRGEGEMRIVSGRPGKEITHYLAPPQQGLKNLVDNFLIWFNAEAKLDGLVKAGIAHLWFELLHPFDDGNGRVGRALIDMLLARDEQLDLRFYSVSKEILSQRKLYYKKLGEACCGASDITAWLVWFLECYALAIKGSIESIKLAGVKHRFWQSILSPAFQSVRKSIE